MRCKVIISITIIFACLLSCQETRFPEGKRLYTFYCENCHMADGTGLAKLVPPLANADYMVENHTNLPSIIKFGLKDTIVVNGVQFDTPMEGYPELNTILVSNIYNYILDTWYPNTKKLSFEEIKLQIE